MTSALPTANNDLRSQLVVRYWPVGLLYFVAYTPVSFFILKDNLGGWVQLAGAVVLVMAVVFYYLTKNVSVMSHALAMIGIPAAMPWLLTGGPMGMGFWWTLAYVVWAFLLCGKKSGTLWLLLYFTIAAVLVGLSLIDVIHIGYSLLALANILFASLVTFFLVYLFSGVVDYYSSLAIDREKNLVQSNEELTKASEYAQGLLQASLKAEAVLKEYEYFFNISSDFSCIVNRTGYYEKINPALETFLGYTQEQILNIPAATFNHPDDAIASSKEYESLKKGNSLLNTVNRKLKKDGSYAWIEWKANLDMTTGKLYANGRDITLQREEEERNRKYAILEAKSKEMEQFSYIASHDLREPLLTIKKYIEVLVEDGAGQLSEDATYYTQSISEAANRMEARINGLLDYSRLSTIKKAQETDCNKIVSDVRHDLTSLIHSTNACIGIDTLPVLQAHPMELSLLFQNLITNAIKFRGKNVQPHIHISSKAIAGGWQFQVRDNGIGIEEQYLAKIFELFQRLHTREEYEGTGIGLSHCKKIAEMHNGSIWVESEYGKGSSFYFTIMN